MGKGKQAVDKAKGFKDEFKKFIMRGNVFDMAVGVIVGGAFGKITTSLVNEIVMPLLSPVMGNLDFSNWFIAMDGNHYDSIAQATEAGVATLNYGNFITVVLDFLIIAFFVFLMVRWFARFSKPKKVEEQPAPTTKQCPYCRSEIAIEATRCPHCTSILDDSANGK